MNEITEIIKAIDKMRGKCEKPVEWNNQPYKGTRRMAYVNKTFNIWKKS